MYPHAGETTRGRKISILSRTSRLGRWRIPAVNDSYLMAAQGQPCRDLCSDPSSASADWRIFVAEEENFHLVTSGRAQSRQPLAIAQLAPEIETFVGAARSMCGKLLLEKRAVAPRFSRPERNHSPTGSAKPFLLAIR